MSLDLALMDLIKLVSIWFFSLVPQLRLPSELATSNPWQRAVHFVVQDASTLWLEEWDELGHSSWSWSGDGRDKCCWLHLLSLAKNDELVLRHTRASTTMLCEHPARLWHELHSNGALSGTAVQRPGLIVKRRFFSLTKEAFWSRRSSREYQHPSCLLRFLLQLFSDKQRELKPNF